MRPMIPRTLTTTPLLLCALSMLSLTDAPSTVYLPGTQPGVVLSFESPSLCQGCHQTSPSGHPVTIGADWRGSMMAHAARDPIFYATVAVANKYVNGVGEYCIRCHSPTGWLEGRANPPTGQGLTGNDLHGVQCDFCHRMKDPMIPDSLIVPPVPGYGNAMMVSQTARTPKRGPYNDALAMFHTVQGDSFYRRGDFCGVCHNVSNPLQAANSTTQAPHEYGVIERTYSEWKLSWYATQGDAGTCQSCHMPPQPGYGCTIMASPLRPDIPRHDLTGGNTFVPDILADFWTTGIDTALLALGKERARQTLQEAATLEARAFRLGDTVTALVRITNLTGHKLPTGYPEGRRMWLSLVGLNAAGDTLFRSGAYNSETADLTADDQLKVYESKPGLTAAAAALHNLQAGPSFHFVLNDTIYKDNRIPPRGFSNSAFTQHMAQPVAHTYADGQYWDDTRYTLPGGVTSISTTLYYQTSSKEYITFLRDENEGNIYDWRAWGDSLYSAWSRRGKSSPVPMATVTATVTDSTGSFTPIAETVPVGITLSQNYPNPFNPSTVIVFALDRPAFVILTVFDLLGREVCTLYRGRTGPGEHRIAFDASGIPSGTYLYRLRADNQISVTRKLLLLR